MTSVGVNEKATLLMFCPLMYDGWGTRFELCFRVLFWLWRGMIVVFVAR